jgi:nitroreductase
MKLRSELLGVEEKTTVYPRRGIRRILHSLLPKDAYDWLRGFRLSFFASPLGQRVTLFGAQYLSFASRFSFLSGLHYTLISSEFSREHRAVLAARARHIKDVYAGRGNLYMLRRNVHRLEKGLIMKPPRPIFGLDKIGETVHAYIACLKQLDQTETGVKSSLEWAKSILDAYFDRVADHPIIAEARAQYLAAGDQSMLDMSVAKTPYRRTTPANLPTIEQLEDLAHFRRSVRWFSDRPVPREAIDRAIRVGMEAPSACNRQPFRYEVFDTKDLVQKVGAIPKGTPGWLHQIPCFVVIIGKFDAFRFERDRHVPYIDGCLSAMGLIYALEAQGISSCCVNFPDFADTEKRMAQVLKLPPWERAIMCLAVGYPDMGERVLYSQKFPLEIARRYNMETHKAYDQAG